VCEKSQSVYILRLMLVIRYSQNHSKMKRDHLSLSSSSCGCCFSSSSTHTTNKRGERLSKIVETVSTFLIFKLFDPSIEKEIMDSNTAKYARGIISDRYVDVGMENIQSTRKLVLKLLSNRKIPEKGWSESAVETFLSDIARMDSNNFEGNTGVGEREGRVICPIVSRRNYHLAHGIGRSGDIAAEQPKAAGSSILAKLVRYLALDAIRMCGVKLAKSALVLPMATGMSLALVFSTLRNKRGPKAKYVVWSRCDQKSCFKAILSAGLEPVVVETKLKGDMVVTDMDRLKEVLDKLDPDTIVCVASTSSCFAPRTCDDLVGIATECQTRNIPHVCNNAYGLQSTRCCHLINEAMRVGRLDAFVQSTDKNFQVPVGGAVVSSSSKSFVEEVGKSYVPID